MTDRHAKISFLASGHVIQDLLITAANVSPESLTEMLNNGTAVTTIQEGKEVVVTSLPIAPIAEVVYTEPEMDYKEFQLEDDYTLPTSKPKQFPISRMAWNMALSFGFDDYIEEPNKTPEEILTILTQAGDEIPPLTILDPYCGMSGNQMLEEIEPPRRACKNFLIEAYSAGTRSEELI